MDFAGCIRSMAWAGRGKAAAQVILTQPAKSLLLLPLLLLPLLPTLLLLKPLLLLTSQMATLGLPGQTLRLPALKERPPVGPWAQKSPKTFPQRRPRATWGPWGP